MAFGALSIFDSLYLQQLILQGKSEELVKFIKDENIRAEVGYFFLRYINFFVDYIYFFIMYIYVYIYLNNSLLLI